MNCRSCNFSVINDGDCICTIHILSKDVIFDIDEDKIDIDCPCHSDIELDISTNLDKCAICGRLVKIGSEYITKINKKDTCVLCELKNAYKNSGSDKCRNNFIKVGFDLDYIVDRTFFNIIDNNSNKQ